MSKATPTHLKDLIPDPENRRKHNPRNLGMVADALRSVGAARSIVIDEDNVVLAGNGVSEAAAEAGIERVQVVDVDGSTLVAVRRRGLSVEQKRALALYDNRTAELAEWDADQLQADVDAGIDLSPWFSEQELTKIVGSTGKPGLTDPEATPDLGPTEIQAGDLFSLGAHRLICGDATDTGCVARLLAASAPMLMVTDPPYGVDYEPAWRAVAGVNENRHKLGRVANDDRADWSEAWRLFPGAVAYVWHAGRFASLVQASLETTGLVTRGQIIWAKDRFALSRGHYHWQHEPCWYAVRKGATAKWCGDRSQSTLWEIPAREDDGLGHGTQKPVECMARPMRHHDCREIYDPFLGSGTSLIAAEQFERACLGIELNPQYCQVAIDRWEAFTGQRAVKVGEAVRV